MRSWLYRIQPSVTSSPFRPSGRIDPDRFGTQFGKDEVECNQLRWRPMPFPEQQTDFVSGLQTICGAGRWLESARACNKLLIDGLMLVGSLSLTIPADNGLDLMVAAQKGRKDMRSTCTAQMHPWRILASAVEMEICSLYLSMVSPLPFLVLTFHKVK